MINFFQETKKNIEKWNLSKIFNKNYIQYLHWAMTFNAFFAWDWSSILGDIFN